MPDAELRSHYPADGPYELVFSELNIYSTYSRLREMDHVWNDTEDPPFRELRGASRVSATGLPSVGAACICEAGGVQ